MCGIIGVLGLLKSVNYSIEGLKLLQNRGYDSVGISTILENMLFIEKYASTTTSNSIELLEKSLKNKNFDECSICIGHTRWATHGEKTDNNAHPHTDNKKTISLVHNGIIENFKELKEELLHEGFQFSSETDTEIIAVLIGKYLITEPTVYDAIQKAISRLHGAWALAIIHKDYTNKMWIASNGSPLLVGFMKNAIMVASEKIAFGNHVTKYCVLQHGDLIEVTTTQMDIIYSKDIRIYDIYTCNNVNIETSPYPFDHWMMKEIMEQPDCIYRIIDYDTRITHENKFIFPELEVLKEKLMNSQHLILLGCGTSLNAGMWAIPLLKVLTIFDTISAYDGAEFSEKDIPLNGNICILFLSQSGETKDLHRCFSLVKQSRICTISIVNVEGSLLSREADACIYIQAGREVSVASTKSFTNQCILLTMIGAWFAQNKNIHDAKCKEIIHDLINLPDQFHTILKQRSIINNITVKFHTNVCFLLGNNSNYAIAKESSLKLKEIGYIHAEGYLSSALKHGPFALIVKDLPIILFDTDHTQINNNVYHEIKSRHAYVIRIVNSIEKVISTHPEDDILYVEKNNTFHGLLANCYIQLLSYYIAISKGYNPDFPRNLAKVVTVE